MRFKIVFLILVLSLLGCKSFLINTALESAGAYDEEISLVKLVKNEKEIVFLPMVHVSTELFFEDVKKR